MKQTYIIRPGETAPLSNLMAWVVSRDVEKTWRVVVGEDKESKSDLQNSLQWVWHGIWAKENGFTKEHAYNRFKYKYVLPIMLADSENVQLNRLWARVRDDKEAVAALVRVIHTSDLTTAEMAEALDEYDRDTASHGLVFPDTDDYKRHKAIGD